MIDIESFFGPDPPHFPQDHLEHRERPESNRSVDSCSIFRVIGYAARSLLSKVRLDAGPLRRIAEAA